MSGDSIRVARDDLLDFLVRAYHLKDALVAEGAVKRGAVEAAITSDSSLALLADIANLNKHGRLDRPPRTGVVPAVEQVSGEGTSDGKRWHLVMRIKHGSAEVDGVQLAQQAIDAWRAQLSTWQLL